MPPTMPAIRPDIKGAPLASAIPRHSGTATRNTTSEAGRSARQEENNEDGDDMGECVIKGSGTVTGTSLTMNASPLGHRSVRNHHHDQ